ncbi:class II fructose-bisphosphate aldolase [Thermogemmatispora sp.]|uniref:class II fructose-bisphosphate aldolase n=1 Tax=Thermogemmatispora sp. TaxID=1968838 RepID=UPI0035E46720
MLTEFATLLQQERSRSGAAVAFTCYGFETAVAVLQAAEKAGRGVILLISAQSYAAPQGTYLVEGLRALAAQAPVPVCLQLDHLRELEQIERAFQQGIGAVMADGSHLPFEENLAFTREAVALARRYGGAIEAELGRIEGDEERAEAVRAGALTDPEQAASFVEEAAPACLAVSIGNVHGLYQREPAFDWERLTTLRARLRLPLALHGASGLSDALLQRAIALGIGKINVNTELRINYFEVLAQRLETCRPGARLLDLQSALIAAQRATALARLQACQLAEVGPPDSP